MKNKSEDNWQPQYGYAWSKGLLPGLTAENHDLPSDSQGEKFSYSHPA